MKNENQNRHIDEMALLAANNEEILEQLIDMERGYILSCAGKTLSRHIDRGSEEELVALEAFVEAVNTYSFEKGGFLSFAKLVISRRLIDHLRREKGMNHFIPMDPADIAITKDRNEVSRFFGSEAGETEIASEIERLSERLKKYGFSFMDLTSSSPKAMKTKRCCRMAVTYILENQIVHAEIRQKNQLPIRIIEKNTGIPRKILDRHRKYIIAVVEILSGGYPCLATYVSSMKKEME